MDPIDAQAAGEALDPPAAVVGPVELAGLPVQAVVDETVGQLQEEVTGQDLTQPLDALLVVEEAVEDGVADLVGVLGAGQAEQTLAESEQSKTVNISFAERYHGTHRHFNARKKRKAYTFSKELGLHEAAVWLVVLWYNFGWCVRTLREKVQQDPRYRQRTPAMAAGQDDRAWAME